MRSRPDTARAPTGGLPSMSPRQTEAYLQAREWIRRARRAATFGSSWMSRSATAFERRGDAGRAH